MSVSNTFFVKVILRSSSKLKIGGEHLKGRIVFVIGVALIFLGVLVVGNKVNAGNNEKLTESTNHHISNHQHVNSEVAVNAFYNNDELVIELIDLNDQVPELELSHEMLMHAIVVSSVLQQYYHVHPENKKDGVYTQQINLPDNIYNVFVDIKPKELNYEIAPIQIHVGNTDGSSRKAKLSEDTNFTKIINGQAVTLMLEAGIRVNEDIMLDFELLGAKPQPYLGALGHVVILNEEADRFVHVHPMSASKTAFHTQFHEPGVYKIWAEFKFKDQVNVYPFVINVL